MMASIMVLLAAVTVLTALGTAHAHDPNVQAALDYMARGERPRQPDPCFHPDQHVAMIPSLWPYVLYSTSCPWL